MTKTILKTRIEARINSDIKSKAQEELSRHGMTISEYVRAAITTVANEGLPKDFGFPSTIVMDSLNEVADDLSGTTKSPSFDDEKSLMNNLDND